MRPPGQSVPVSLGTMPPKYWDRLAASAGVRARLDGDCALFLLSPDTRFEDLDYLWGSLFDLLA